MADSLCLLICTPDARYDCATHHLIIPAIHHRPTATPRASATISSRVGKPRTPSPFLLPTHAPSPLLSHSHFYQCRAHCRRHRPCLQVTVGAGERNHLDTHYIHHPPRALVAGYLDRKGFSSMSQPLLTTVSGPPLATPAPRGEPHVPTNHL
jgi:hypothetical protein